MSSWAHAVLYILDRSPFRPVTIHLWATRSCFTLHWPLNAHMLGPNIFSSELLVAGWFCLCTASDSCRCGSILARTLQWYYLCCAVNGPACRSSKTHTHTHTMCLQARLIMHDNIIATLLLLQQDFVRPVIGSLHILHVVDSSAAWRHLLTCTLSHLNLCVHVCM